MYRSELNLKIIAIELDKTLSAFLKTKYGDNHLKIVQANILNLNLHKICNNFFHDTSHWRVIGNLPYNISTPILFKLFNYRNKIKDQHFMLQNEVVNRMVAVPGNKIYGRLSVVLQSAYKIEKVFEVKSESFFPKPKVNSAFVKMTRDDSIFSTILNWKVFSDLVTHSFSSRRKTIKNNLKNFLDILDFDRVNADQSDRAENISVVDYIELSNQITVEKNLKSKF